MKMLISLIGGFVGGWLANQTLWQRDYDPVRKQLALAQAEISSLHASLASAQRRNQALQTAEAEAHTEIDRLQGQLKALRGKATVTTSTGKANFQQIDGIGPTYTKRLHQAGVTTFAALAALTPDQVQEIVAAKVGLKVKPEDWIAEAARLAQEQNS